MPTNIQVSRPDIEEWVTRRVADYLRLAEDDIQPDVPLAQYGLDSVFAVGLCGDIEDRFPIEVEPTLAWDHPTVEAIAQSIAAQLDGRYT